eukprot:scaffold251026_cov30-Tisochrysis_lutea.AAC.2
MRVTGLSRSCQSALVPTGDPPPSPVLAQVQGVPSPGRVFRVPHKGRAHISRRGLSIRSARTEDKMGKKARSA